MIQEATKRLRELEQQAITGKAADDPDRDAGPRRMDPTMLRAARAAARQRRER